jgi:predicted nucleotidyltransferase
MDPERIADIARRHGIALLLRFGSSVAGPMHATSDIDLGVLLERAPDTLAEEADLVTDLQSLVADREVDVAFLNRADPLFLKQVTSNCALIYGNRRRFQEFLLYAFKRYQDYRPYLRLEREYVERMTAPARS